MNIMHSSRSDTWYTPTDILVRVYSVLGRVDLDPASDGYGNVRVGATRFITEQENGLTALWTGENVFINPPGGKVGNKSQTALFWKKLMEYRMAGQLDHAIFLAFSLEALQTTQGKGCPSIGEFPMCIPSKRIRFDFPGEVKKAPSHSNAIVYVPGRCDLRKDFATQFEDLGVILNVGGWHEAC